MGVFWSWAFGPELPAALNDVGWQMTTNAAYLIPSSDPDRIYTYPGSPTRYSINAAINQLITVPNEAWPADNAGWWCAPIKSAGAGTWNPNQPIIRISGDTGHSFEVQVENAGTNELRIRWSQVSWPYNYYTTMSGTYVHNDWHYVAVRFDMSVSPWMAEVWMNGVLAYSGSHPGSGPPPATTGGSFTFGGFNNQTYASNGAAAVGQCVVYTTASLPVGQHYDSMYCTRANPTVDTATTGTWTPSVGSDDFAVLSAPYDESTFTSNTGSAVGDRVICQVQNLATQLGTTPSVIPGITLHSWASGSGQKGFSALSDNNASYVSSPVISPDINDPTYCTISVSAQPSNGHIWNATSSLYIKYEVS